MARPELSVYDVEFSIYDVDFAVFDIENTHDSLDIPEALPLLPAIADVAIRGEIETTVLFIPEVEPTPVDTNILELPNPTVITIARAAVAEKQDALAVRIEEEVLIPAHVQERVTNVLDRLISRSDRPLILSVQVTRELSNRTSIPPAEYRELLAAIKADGRLEHFKNGAYIIMDRAKEVEQAYLAGEDPLKDLKRIPVIIQGILNTIVTNEDGFVAHSAVLGSLNGLGYELTKDEAHELIAQLTTHPRVTPLDSGDFIITGTQVSFPGERKVPKTNESGRPLTTSTINRELRAIKASDEMKKAVDQAKRIANPRTHGKNFRKKGSLMRGKNHGKVKTFEQLVADMNNRNSQQPNGTR